jgi:hypothetical protein
MSAISYKDRGEFRIFPQQSGCSFRMLRLYQLQWNRHLSRIRGRLEMYMVCQLAECGARREEATVVTRSV